jgi:hypothetical protein
MVTEYNAVFQYYDETYQFTTAQYRSTTLRATVHLLVHMSLTQHIS